MDSPYDGVAADALRAAAGLERLIVAESLPSTQDVAHEAAAAGAPSGTLVLADEQTRGRGRGGRVWRSGRGSGIWMTLVEREVAPSALAVLSLRLGLAAAGALDAWAPSPIRLKWPNDLLVDGAKLAGILVEARWRDGGLEWVAIGVGINARVDPDVAAVAAALRDGARRADVVTALVPALRAAGRAVGPLTGEELDTYRARDAALGRACEAPARGVVGGIDATGALLVDTSAGRVACRSGSLVFATGSDDRGT